MATATTSTTDREAAGTTVSAACFADSAASHSCKLTAARRCALKPAHAASVAAEPAFACRGWRATAAVWRGAGCCWRATDTVEHAI